MSKEAINDGYPLVSVIVPMFNCEKYIARSLESLLHQNYENIEIIVVDDGSNDKSAELVTSYALSDKRVIYLYQENAGPGVARNRALDKASGKYLLFVDSDDFVGKNYIIDLVMCAEKNASEMVFTGYTLVYEDGKKSVEVIPKRYEKNVYEEWAYRISACCSRLYLKEFWDANGLHFYQEIGARAEDVPIVLYANAMAKNISLVKKADYFYFQHEGSAMNSTNKKVLFLFPYRAFKAMYERVYSFSLENGQKFLDIGILKFLTQFDIRIYRHASKDEKSKFKNYIIQLLTDDWKRMEKNWINSQATIGFPILYKLVITVFVIKYHCVYLLKGKE